MYYNDDEIQQRAAKRVKEKVAFFRSLFSYLSTNVVLWGIFFVTSGSWNGRGIPWPMYVTVFWGIGIASQAFRLFLGRDFLAQYEQREMEKEVQRERERIGMTAVAKRKNDDVELGDDGELIYQDDEAEFTGRRSRSG